MPDEDQYTVVVGVDGAPASIAALKWAIEEARCRNGCVRAVHAWMAPRDWQEVPIAAVDDDRLQRAARRELDDAVASVDARGVQREVVEGDPRTVLVDAAKDGDLLVVGSHGRNALVRALLGSVSTYCVHHAPGPVVVVRVDA